MINPGTRPSRLELGRHATGEVDLGIGPNPYLDALNAERARVEPFDFEILRARAERIADPAPTRPTVPWWRRMQLFVPVLALAAAALVFTPKDVVNRIKGDADLGFYLLRGDEVLPGAPDAVFHEGDRIQFSYRAPYSSLILVSIDGDGFLTRYYPESGEVGVAIIPGSRHLLDGSVVLDDAPGPEVFIGFFGEDWTVSDAKTVALDAWQDGGLDALIALGEDDPTITTLPLEKE
jgi:hypothetical protein